MNQNKERKSGISQLICMHEVCDPCSSMSSTAALTVSIHGGHKTFSFPPFFYYAEKARLLAQFSYASESDAKADGADVHQQALREIRGVARKIYSELLTSDRDEKMSGYISGLIQHALLTRLLHDGAVVHPPKEPQKSISMNATRAKKNITVPIYLYERLIQLYGESGVTSQINLVALGVKEKLAAAGLSDERGDPIGVAANASWSRKVHNILFMSLCQLTLQMQKLPGWELIPMERVFEIETAYLRGALIGAEA